MRMRLIALALLAVGCGTFVLVAAEPVASQALCDRRSRGPAETAAYSAIRDLLDAENMVLGARVARYEKQNHLSASPTDFYVALEREARAAECAASLLEPYGTSLVSLYREVASSARRFREFVTTAAGIDVTRENEAKWSKSVTNFMVDQKLFDEDARRGEARLTDLGAAIAAFDPSCLTPGRRSCERNRLAITRKERAWLLAGLTAVPDVKLTNLRTVLEGPTSALDDTSIAVWLFDVDDASLPNLRWVGGLDRDACDTAFRKAGEPKSGTRPCRPMLLVQDGAQGVGESVWVSTVFPIVFLTATQSTCEAFRVWKESGSGEAPAPCESFRLSTAR